MIRITRPRKESAKATNHSRTAFAPPKTTSEAENTSAAAAAAAAATTNEASPPTSPKACPICYEDFSVVIDSNTEAPNDNMLKTIHPCQHVCCRDCLYEHCQYCIVLHKVPIGCPQHLIIHKKDIPKKNQLLPKLKHTNKSSTTPAAANTTMCSATLSHSLVHDVICLCRIDNLDEHGNVIRQDDQPTNDATDDKGDAEEEKKAEESCRATEPTQTPPVYVVCRKNDPLWNKYVNCCEAKRRKPPSQPSDEHIISSLPSSSVLPIALSTSNTNLSSSDDSFATARADNENNDDDNDDSSCSSSSSTSSSTPPSNIRIDPRGPIIVFSNKLQNPTGLSNITAATADMHREHERLSQSVLSSLQIKPCSHCSMPLNKTGGCDHVVCPACHLDMCYRCGTHRYLQGQGYIRSCMGCQQDYIDHRHLPRNGFMFWCVYAPCCLLPIILIYPFFVIVRLVIFCCCYDYASNNDIGPPKNRHPSANEHEGDDELGATIQLGTSRHSAGNARIKLQPVTPAPGAEPDGDTNV